MTDEYKGVKVGIEVELGNAMLTELAVTVILLEEVRRRHPRAFDAAVEAIRTVDEPVITSFNGKPL